MKKETYQAPASEFQTFQMGDIIATYGEPGDVAHPIYD